MGFLSKAEGKKSFLNDKGALGNSKVQTGRPAPKDELESTLEQYFKTNSSVGGMVINVAKNEVKKISPMVSHFALAEELSSGFCIILFSESLDRDLIAHRLKNNLGTEIPLIFKAGSPAEALQKIRPYR